MYEKLMKVFFADENCRRALGAVKRNRGAAGSDQMKTTELESHLQAHWERIGRYHGASTTGSTICDGRPGAW